MGQNDHTERGDKPLRVAYLGPPASFSHQAALAVFPRADLSPFPSFPSIFDNIQKPAEPTADQGGADQEDAPLMDFAVLPIENSTNGSVVQALDLLTKCTDGSQYADLQVCEEHYLTVHHFLYTTTDSNNNNKNIKVLYSHPQVWTQCSKYLAQHFPHAERIDVSSTSAAAGLVAKDGSGNSAAICSQLAGDSWKLKCLAENIEDEVGKNTTRFFVLRNRKRSRGAHSLPSRRHCPRPRSHRGGDDDDDDNVNTKALVLFTIDNAVPGSLSTVLQVFARHGLNLTRIDTRPSRQVSWNYVFFVECEERLPLEDVVVDDESKDTTFTAAAAAAASSSSTTPSTTTTTTTMTASKLQAASEELRGLTKSVSCLGRWVDMLQFKTK